MKDAGMRATSQNSTRSLHWSIAVPEPRVETLVTPDELARTARAVEAAGFDGIWVTDHPLPLDLSFPSGKGVAATAKLGAGHQTWDPFVSLAWLAQVTHKLMLHTNAVVLPYRNPFLVAKAAATLQHLSGGRLIMSVAAGYLKAEFDALGVDIEARDTLMEEGMEALKAAWIGKPFTMSSAHWKVDGNAALPAPNPQPLLWRAGNSRNAISHAARAFDAWIPFEVTADNARATRTAPLSLRDGLIERIALFRELCIDAGRPRTLDICLVRSNWLSWIDRSKQEVRDELQELREAGVTWIMASVTTSNADEFLRRLEMLRTIVL